MNEIKKKIREIILNSLRLKHTQTMLEADRIENWDSIGHLQIISALEKKFKINLSSKQISQMLSEKKIYDIISKIQKVK